MKKLLLAIAVLSVSNIAYGSCQGPYCYDDTGAEITSRITVPSLRMTGIETVDVDVTTPTVTGLFAFDSVFVLYVSTSTARGGYQKVGAQ
jgi:hypothetical protein